MAYTAPANTRLTMMRVIRLIILSVLLRGMLSGAPARRHECAEPAAGFRVQDFCGLMSAVALPSVLRMAASLPQLITVSQPRLLTLGIETPPDHPPPI